MVYSFLVYYYYYYLEEMAQEIRGVNLGVFVRI